MEALDLVDAGPNAIQDVVEPGLLADLPRGVQDEQAVGPNVMVHLCTAH
jgi:hypothetical protein